MLDSSSNAATSKLVWGPPFRISVQPSPALLDAALSLSIDTPTHGHISESWTIEVSGFIFPWAPVENRKPIKLQFKVGDVEFWSTPIDLPRPDLQSHPKFRPEHVRCGYSTVLPSFLHNKSTVVDIWLEEQRSGADICAIHIATISFEPINASHVTATRGTGSRRVHEIGLLHITSIGRSGSSLLSRMLSLYEDVFVPQLFGQYGETSILSYFLRALAVLSSEGCYGALNQFEASSDILSLPVGYWRFDGGQMPFDLTSVIQANIRERLLDLLDEVAVACARAARAQKPRVRYWLEKNWNNLSANLAPDLFDLYREIVMVRSLPSFWRSQIDFNEKIMTPERYAGLDAKDTFDKYLNLARTALDSERGALVIKYEDLMRDPADQIARIATYLNLPRDEARTQQILAVVNARDDFRTMLSTAREPIEAAQTSVPPLLVQAIQDLEPNYRNYLREQIVCLGYDAFF